jgi:hypothetical protein
MPVPGEIKQTVAETLHHLAWRCSILAVNRGEADVVDELKTACFGGGTFVEGPSGWHTAVHQAETLGLQHIGFCFRHVATELDSSRSHVLVRCSLVL